MKETEEKTYLLAYEEECYEEAELVRYFLSSEKKPISTPVSNDKKTSP